MERLRLGKLDGPPQYRVLLTCRHHCCEMMANWVLEGIMDAVLDEDEPGRWLRQNVELLAIPFVGTVLMLPIYVFQRSYSLFYLAQYGPEFNAFAFASQAIAPAAPPVP